MSRYLWLSPLCACLLFTAAAVPAQELSEADRHQERLRIEAEELKEAECPLEKASLFIEYADRRLAEARSLLSEENYRTAEERLKLFEKSLNEALSQISRAQSRGLEVYNTFSDMDQASARHLRMLTEWLETASRDSRIAIRDAQSTARNANNSARSWLDRRDLLPDGTSVPLQSPGGASSGGGKNR
jgi:hypothetical protein